jgi:FAD/FMN-containing dehydrogenase
LKLTAASLLAGSVGVAPWVKAASQGSLPSGLPALDGDLLVDDAHRQAAAWDGGLFVHRSPIAVLKPQSVEDVARIVRYANSHSLKIAMRGQGHSLYGQALVEGGIVIDSSTLNTLRMQGQDVLDAGPGALWGEVAKISLAQERLPPVMPDAMMLSVGGTLSAGGMGETGYRYGAQVDHVVVLDVVTGSGDLVTCSADRNSELFRMALAGLGQCGLIVRARLRLMQTLAHVVMRTLTYDDMEDFLTDQARLTQVDGLSLLNGAITKDTQGRWQFALIAGNVVAKADEGDRPPAWMAGMRHKSAAAPVATPIWDYLNRRTARVNAAKVNPRPSPSIALTLPDSSIRPFLTHLLSTPEASIGIWFFEVSPKIPERHRQPLQKVPAGSMAYELRMQRRPSAVDAPDHRAMLAANQALLPRVLEADGKIYPPYAPILSKTQWQQHYGSETWQRFAAAKKRFDPNGVLTPGAGIF